MNNKPFLLKGILLPTPLVKERKDDDWKYYSKIFYDNKLTVKFAKTCMHDLPEYFLGTKKGSHWLFEQMDDLVLTNYPKLPEKVQQKLDLPSLPSFLHDLKWLWWGNNKELNSGLHFDENGGGYLGVLTGKKEVLLMPPESKTYLPMYTNSNRSKIFAWKYIDANTTHPSFKHVKMYKITVEKGDMLYIPDRWFHEVKSSPKTIAITGWVVDIDINYHRQVKKWSIIGLIFVLMIILGCCC